MGKPSFPPFGLLGVWRVNFYWSRYDPLISICIGFDWFIFKLPQFEVQKTATVIQTTPRSNKLLFLLIHGDKCIKPNYFLNHLNNLFSSFLLFVNYAWSTKYLIPKRLSASLNLCRNKFVIFLSIQAEYYVVVRPSNDFRPERWPERWFLHHGDFGLKNLVFFILQTTQNVYT